MSNALKWTMVFFLCASAGACSGNRRADPALAFGELTIDSANPAAAETCSLLREQLNSTRSPQRPTMLVRASTPARLQKKSKCYQDGSEMLGRWKGTGGFKKITTKLSALWTEMSSALSASASSISAQDTDAYPSQRDLVDELFAEEAPLLEAAVDACRGIGIDSKPKATHGRLSKKHIQATVRRAYDRFQRCYEQGLARDGKLEGRVTVRFVISKDGTVSSVTVSGRVMPSNHAEIAALGFLKANNDDLPSLQQGSATTIPDDEVITCIARHYYDIKFDSPKGGIVTVVYPIMFSPS